MKLREKEIYKLRKYVEKQLENVPKETRIKLDKDLLELLLFDKIIYDQKKGAVVKLPIWSGDFLSKVDLSEIDFEDVSWSLLSDPSLAHQYFDEEALKIYTKRTIMIATIYRNTNANIDFTKSFEAKNSDNKLTKIRYCNFSGTNLSSQSISSFETIEHCNLADTKLQCYSLGDLGPRVNISDTDFTNCDFSTNRISIYRLICGATPFDYSCVFKNTGLKLSFDLNEFNSGVIENCYYRLYKDPKECKSRFGTMIKEGKLDGCYIHVRGQDGFKIIHSNEERMAIKNQKQEEYNSYYSGLESMVGSSIQKKIGEMKPNS